MMSLLCVNSFSLKDLKREGGGETEPGLLRVSSGVEDTTDTVMKVGDVFCGVIPLAVAAVSSEEEDEALRRDSAASPSSRSTSCGLLGDRGNL